MIEKKTNILDLDISEVDDAIEKYGSNWQSLNDQDRQLAEKITMLTYYAGGRSKAAHAMGVGVTTIDNYRSGKTQPKFFELLKLAEAADHDVKYLLSGTEFTSVSETETGPELVDQPEQLPVDIPIYGTAAGSISGSVAILSDVIDWVARPAGLKNAQHSYALYVSGNSMQPKYSPGDIIFLHPGRPPKSGDIVVVQTQNHDGADVISFVKEYIKPTDDGILTRQYNKPVDIEFKTNTIKAIHRVMTTNELLGV
ncbi:MAG: S24 family peptidase [Rhizobiaceae bacterium]